MKTNHCKGSDLCAIDRQHVLAAYVHRYTGEHKPAWANSARPNGEPYKPQFSTDQDWLEHTTFAVTKSGRLDKRVNHCESSPTWPEGQ